jgi:hypothetical protein
MNASNASEHVLDNFPYEMGLAAKLVETAILPFLVGFAIGMYRGIEINHPGKIVDKIICVLNLRFSGFQVFELNQLQLRLKYNK